MEETVATVLARKYPHEPPPPPCSLFEVYEDTPILVLMDITEDVIKSYTQNLLESLGPGGTHLGALRELILKRGEDSKRICTSVEFFVDWLAN